MSPCVLVDQETKDSRQSAIKVEQEEKSNNNNNKAAYNKQPKITHSLHVFEEKEEKHSNSNKKQEASYISS
jgi:hypothetical protein